MGGARRSMIVFTIDRIHDTRNLCARFRINIDGRCKSHEPVDFMRITEDIAAVFHIVGKLEKKSLKRKPTVPQSFSFR